MNILKRNSVVSKRHQYKIICALLYLVVIMTKIVSYACQDFSVSVSINGVSKKVFAVPVDDLLPCSGKPNCYYQRNTKYCTKMTQLSIRLKFTDPNASKPPPLVATLTAVTRKKTRGLFKGAHISMDSTKPLELVLCDKRFDMLQWAKTSVLANTSLPPPLNLIFSIVDPDTNRAQKLKTVALEFSRIFIVIFKDPPACVLADDVNHKLFWTDGNRGTVEAYDTKTNDMIILASSLTMPGSMVIDSTFGLLFWCNFAMFGSIERINTSGENRVDITKAKYNLHFPETLGIDLANRMLFWMSYDVIHTSDYNGDSHKLVEKSESYDPHFPGCISFADDAEHTFFWENHQVQHYNRSFSPNHLVSISYRKNGKTVYNMKLPAVFSEQQNMEQIDWRASKKCPRKIPAGYHCLSLPVPFNTSTYAWINHTMADAGYKSMSLRRINRLPVRNEELFVKVKWFYFNSKTKKVFYYDPMTKHIRTLFFVIRDMQHNVLFKHKTNTKRAIASIVKNINESSTDLIVFYSNEKSVYLLNTTDNSTKRYEFDGNNSRIFSSPHIFAYITQVIDYNNNAQAHTIVIRKFVLTTVFKLILQSLIFNGCALV